MSERLERIKTLLTNALQAQLVEVVDDSEAHRGHAGARDGGGHFNVTVVSKQFQNLSLIKRHRLVYTALDDMLKTDIHALSIKALTPEEH